MQNKIANEPQKYNTPPPKSNVLMHDKVVDKLQEECKKHNCIAKCEKAPTTIINKEVNISYKKSPEELENEAKAFLYQPTMEKSAENKQSKEDQSKEFSLLLEINNWLAKAVDQMTVIVNHLEEVTKELKGDRVQ